MGTLFYAGLHAESFGLVRRFAVLRRTSRPGRLCSAKNNARKCVRPTLHEGQHAHVDAFGEVALWWDDPAPLVVLDQVLSEAAAMTATGHTRDEVAAFVRAGHEDARRIARKS